MSNQAPSPGSLLAGYRIRRTIGSGTTGTVYAADDPQLPRVVALKVISAEASADPRFHARFLREAELAARLDHPNIVAVYDRGETLDRRLWIAMQLVDGTDAETAARSAQMTPARAVHVITQIGAALDYAHHQGIVHRDVRPANFLLSGPVDTGEHALLTDFGIARALDDAGLTGTVTASAGAAYTAPEVLNGEPATPRSDLYSLGCALYELLTGTIPYPDAAGPAAQAMAHLRRPPPHPSLVAPQLGDGFDAVIATAMAKNPSHRFASGQALAAAAHDALLRAGLAPAPSPVSHNEAVPAETASAGQAGRRRLLIGSTAAIAVIAAGVAGFSLTAGRPSADPHPTTATPTSTAPIVADNRLPELLLPTEQLSAVIGLPTRVLDDLTEPTYHYEQSCGPAFLPGTEVAYANTGFTALSGQNLTRADVGDQFLGRQVVIALPSAATATRFIARQQASWQACRYNFFSEPADGEVPPLEIQFADVVPANGVVTMTATKKSAPQHCQHAITAHNNVVVDILACTEQSGDPAVTIAQRIVDRIRR